MVSRPAPPAGCLEHQPELGFHPLLPHELTERGGPQGAFEGGVLLALFSLSTTLAERAMGRARRAIESLMEMMDEPREVVETTESNAQPDVTLKGDVIF